MNARALELIAALRSIARTLLEAGGIGFYVPAKHDLVQIDAVNGAARSADGCPARARPARCPASSGSGSTASSRVTSCSSPRRPMQMSSWWAAPWA